MRKIIVGFAVVLFVSISFLMACSGGKSAADLAIKTAEEAVNATKAEAVKIVPDQVKSLEDTLAAAKEKFVQGEYKAALEEATALAGKAKEVLAAAKAKKEELTKKWTELSQGLPKMVEEIQVKVDSLSKVKKLPASITKEGLEESKVGLASLREEWGKVQQIFTSGNLVEAVNAVTSLKDKTVKIMEALGLSAPVAAPVAAPVPAPIAAPTPAAAK
jgi:nucleotide-binding universal stress UspA family protein